MPLTACLDCGELIARPRYGRCEIHAKAQQIYHQSKRTASPHSNSRAWRGLSMRLRADQPWCSSCGTQGSERNPLGADHLVPLADGGELIPHDGEEGLQVLCRRCNSGAGKVRHGRGRLSA